ncbi:MAG: hypothetical protein P4L16_02155 [Chlamydiales bacterium]|nr:hypothetical protein [Chlamydiales bacterium]
MSCKLTLESINLQQQSALLYQNSFENNKGTNSRFSVSTSGEFINGKVTKASQDILLVDDSSVLTPTKTNNYRAFRRGDCSSKASQISPKANRYRGQLDLDEEEIELPSSSCSPAIYGQRLVLDTPETPAKKRPSRRRFEASLSPTSMEVDTAVSKFQEIHQNAIKGNLFYNNQEFELSKISGGRGSYCQVFKIKDENASVIQISENTILTSSILIKTYHEENKNSSTKKLMDAVLNNYKQWIVFGFPIATIYNASTATEDGFYIIENILHAINPQEWSKYNSIEEFSDADQSVLKQVKAIFILMASLFLPMDIKPDNVRMTKSGVVTIVDILEKDVSEMNGRKRAGNFLVNTNQALTLWSFGKEFIRDYLIEGIVGKTLEEARNLS